MSPTNFHIAQINVARMRGAIDDPVMADFVAQLAEINALADASPGFVWRLADESGGAATQLRIFDDHRILVNMSVWESIEALRAFTYRSRHAALLRDRRKWFEALEAPHLVLWWIRAGEIPTVEEAQRRLALLEEQGPSPEAFTFRERFSVFSGGSARPRD